MTTSRYVRAPAPPAGPGEQPEPDAITGYVAELARWRLHRDHELRAIDELARTHDERDVLNGEVTAAMTLFHAIAQRHDLLIATWGGGDGQGHDQPYAEGPGEDERGWVSQLVWGVLELPDGDAGALAMPLPDALRLSDVMATHMRVLVGADQEVGSLRDRRHALEEELARVRTLLMQEDEAAEPELPQRLDRVAGRLADLDGRDDAAALVELSQVGLELAAVDRAVVVGRATKAHHRADHGQAVAERAHLQARGEAVRTLAQRALDSINPAPRLGIPDVEALGEVPEDEAALSTYVANLERVGRAMDQAHAVYAAALAEHVELADRAQRLARTLAGCGAPTSVDLAGMLTAAKESLNNRPADIRRAAALVAAQEAYLAELRTDR